MVMDAQQVMLLGRHRHAPTILANRCRGTCSTLGSLRFDFGHSVDSQIWSLFHGARSALAFKPICNSSHAFWVLT